MGGVKAVCWGFSRVLLMLKWSVVGEDRSGVAWMGFLGRWEKRCFMVFIQGHLKEMDCLAVQVTEMLCIYCLKAISNPSISASCIHTQTNYGERVRL